LEFSRSKEIEKESGARITSEIEEKWRKIDKAREDLGQRGGREMK
jgi:hypothetical protein